MAFGKLTLILAVVCFTVTFKVGQSCMPSPEPATIRTSTTTEEAATATATTSAAINASASTSTSTSTSTTTTTTTTPAGCMFTHNSNNGNFAYVTGCTGAPCMMADRDIIRIYVNGFCGSEEQLIVDTTNIDDTETSSEGEEYFHAVCNEGSITVKANDQTFMNVEDISCRTSCC